jgi:ribose 5-phosphate isomerase
MAKSTSKQILKSDDKEMQQIEDSVDIASDFIHDVLLPQLDEFELDNDDREYMTGMATHGLFVELVQRMIAMGYTEKDLKKEIKIYAQLPWGETIH